MAHRVACIAYSLPFTSSHWTHRYTTDPNTPQRHPASWWQHHAYFAKTARIDGAGVNGLE